MLGVFPKTHMKITLHSLIPSSAALMCALVPAVAAAEPPIIPVAGSPAATTGISTPSAPLMALNEKQWTFACSAGWTSRYISEGIDCAPGTSIWEVVPSATWNNATTLSAWYASGVENAYDEVDIVLSHTFTAGKWSVTPWYEHQFYMTPNETIANPAVTIARDIADGVSLGFDAQWKLEHKNIEGYYDVFLQGEWQPSSSWSIASMIRFGYNSGYNVSVDDGANCIDYSVKITWQISEHVSLSASVLYSQAATVLRRVELGDEFAYGIAAGVEF